MRANSFIEIYLEIYKNFKNIYFPSNIYLFRVNGRNTWKMFEMYSKLTIKTPERHHWRRSGVFIVRFEHILQVKYLTYLTLNT